MRHYELVVVLSPMMNPDEAGEAWDRIKGFITNREADINFEEKWGTRRLAYPIRKGQFQFLEGSYHLTRFSTDHPFNRELETYLKVDDQVLRSMVTSTLPEDELAAQAAAQARAIRPPPRLAPMPGAEGAPGSMPAIPAPAPVATEEAPPSPADTGEAETTATATEKTAVESTDAAVTEAEAPEAPEASDATETETPVAEDAAHEETPDEDAAPEEAAEVSEEETVVAEEEPPAADETGADETGTDETGDTSDGASDDTEEESG